MKQLAIVLMSLALIATAAVAKDKIPPTFGSRGNLDCSAAEVLECNTSVSSSTIGLPNNVGQYGCVGWDESGGEKVFEFTLDEESTITARIFAMGLDLDIFLLGSCDEADCISHGNQLITTVLDRGTYYIVVDGFNGVEDIFAIELICEAVPEPAPVLDGGDTCAQAVDLQTAGLPRFSTDLSGYTDTYDGGGCFSWHMAGGDAVYSIELDAGESFEVELESTGDAGMYVFDDCGSGAALACADDHGSGSPEELIFTAFHAGTYYLVLDSWSVAGGEVVLTVANPVSNQDTDMSTLKAMFR